MGRTKHPPVSVSDAKDRLKEVASEGDLLSWVQRNPAEGVAAALILGYLVGATPKAKEALRDAAFLLLKRR